MHALAQRVQEPVYHCRLRTRLGEIVVTSDGACLTGLYFEGQKHAPQVGPHWRLDDLATPFAQVREQLEAYAEGRLLEFDLPVALAGTPFQRRVWDALRRVAHGDTISYGELAHRIGAPTAVRAVGGAVGRNPVSVIVPCHRIVGSDGSLTGYAGGLDRKRALLQLECAARSTHGRRESRHPLASQARDGAEERVRGGSG
jgi:methylated-DNA-[protein]-cysteine S-methyltransferase